mmetsp:Transcript_28046/g.24756  ORF Transcript_28046/g.24756 Transcript_28046/m.24756 type:complete len:207 (-) Transcript_28046:1140-1760(-)
MGGSILHNAKQLMDIPFLDIAIMDSIHADGLGPEFSVSGLVRNFFIFGLAISVELAVIEVGNLVHVEPDTIKWHFLVQIFKHVSPISVTFGVEEIWEMDSTRPDFARHIVSFEIFDKDISLYAFASASSPCPFNFDTSINEWDPFLLFSLEEVFHFSGREFGRVDCEIFLLLHIIKIVPHNIKRDVIVFEFIDNSSYSVDILISPS